MSSRHRSATPFALAALLLAACTGGEPKPVPIALDEDICAHCRMAVSQRELAAELVTRDGRVEIFDDVGCLAARIRQQGRPEGSGAFVVDYAGGDWLAAERAVFLHAPALPTPMGSGLAAFTTRTAADDARRRLGGEVIDWQRVVAGVGDGPRERR